MWPYIIFPVLHNRKPYFLRIGRYVMEITRWFLSSAGQQNKPENVKWRWN